MKKRATFFHTTDMTFFVYSSACRLVVARLFVTSSGARAMRGFGAMCWRVFLAPQCAALRCPRMSALVLPVVRVPSCARGPPGVLFTAHPHMYNKSVLQ